MQPKSSKETGSFRNTRVILLTFIVFILIVFIFWSQAQWILFVIVFLILVIFSSMLFWQQYALPNLSIAEHFFLAKNILINQFTRSPLILSIKDGKIEGDYPLLKNKPEIKVLSIDHKSVVLIENASDQKSFLLNGIHVLNKNPKIIGVYDLGIRFLQIGPSGKNELGPKFSNESLADYHLRKVAVERTKTKLSSGDLIYPSFTIFYRIAVSGDEIIDGKMFQSIYEKFIRGDSDLVSSDQVDEFIIFQLLNNWNSFCENKNSDEIRAEFSNSIELSELNEFNIKSRISLDHIY